MTERSLIIGTRGSRLALEQTRMVQELLPGLSNQRIVRTSGDRFQDKALCEQDGIGLFTKEIEHELKTGSIDLAVHSLKDLPIRLAEGLVLGAMLRRAESSDMLLVRSDAADNGRRFPLKPGSIVGASSLRRRALLKRHDPDLVTHPIRGNVPTRLQKAVQGEFDAVILARAGISRLGVDAGSLLAFDLNPLYWPGAAGQGAIAVECREDDREVLERLIGLDDQFTRICVQAERSLLETYGGGCHAPFGAWVHKQSNGFHIVVAAPDNHDIFNLGSFDNQSLEQAKDAAERWIGLGCPSIENLEEETWICRPARPWC